MGAGTAMGSRTEAVKNYTLVVEPWRGDPGERKLMGETSYKWRVTWQLNGSFYAEGFADSHAAARGAAEDFLVEKGIELVTRAW